MLEERIQNGLVELAKTTFPAKYRGKVVNNEDPEKRGRVEVSVPNVLGPLTKWAEPCLPFAGENTGMFTIPEIGSGVWVEFEGGDSSYPIYTGGWWCDSGEVPDNHDGNKGSHNDKVLRSKTGLQIRLSDADRVLSVSDSTGSNMLTIEVENGQVKIIAAAKAIVEAPEIELVEGASERVVFGNKLLNYLKILVNAFNSHTHPGELALGSFPVTPAPPVGQMLSPTPELLSRRVKTG